MKHLLLTILAVIAFNVNAVTINETTDSYLDSVFLDYGQYSRDTTSGLEWLNFSELVNDGIDKITLQNSINSADSWYGDQGWRLATSTEVYTLFDLFFGDYVSDAGENGKMALYDSVATASDPLIEARNSWMFAFGTQAEPFSGDDLNTVYGDLFSYGLYVDEHGDVQFLGTYLGTGSDAELTSHIYGPDHDLTSLTRDSAFTNAGVFMVRATVVPIPAAIWLFGTGLIGLVAVARRKAT